MLRLRRSLPKKSNWIKCSERLPELDSEDYEYYLVSYFYNEKREVYFAEWCRNKFFSSEIPVNSITHWMPLPQPPREDE